jgi:hypothetical protein
MRSAWKIGGAVSVVAIALMIGAAAHADIPKQVQTKFRGHILITNEPLPEDVMDAKSAISEFKKLDKKALKGEAVDGVKSWTFFYTAFLKKAPGTGDLTLDFHTADKEKLYVANKRLKVNGSLTIIAGRLTISEDDGPAAGKTYHLILRAKLGKKELEIAKTKLKLE